MDIKEELEKKANGITASGGERGRAKEKGKESEKKSENPASHESEAKPVSMEADEKGIGREPGLSQKHEEKMAPIKGGTVSALKIPQPEVWKIRLLKADEIECRVSTVSEKGVSLLLYKDARVDQKILDETFTPFGWRRTHQSIDGNLYCTVEVYDREKQEWVAKQDVGTTSYTEKEKGQASDSIKRACFNWGIGRELYTAPFIWIPAGKVSVIQKGDRYTTYDRFTVRHIAYGESREISELIIANGKGTVVYTLGSVHLPTGHVPVEERPSGQLSPSGQLAEPQLKALMEELERTGVTLEAVLARYQLPGLNAMTKEVYEKAMRSLKRTKPKQAA